MSEVSPTEQELSDKPVVSVDRSLTPTESYGSRKAVSFKSSSQDPLVRLFCFWVTTKSYELWIIFSIVFYFAIWSVFLLLVLTYLTYGVAMCQMSFTSVDDFEVLHEWAKTKDFYYTQNFQSGVYFEMELYLSEILPLLEHLFFKEGIIVTMVGLFQLLIHCYGFFAFYLRYTTNLLLYSVALCMLCAILIYQGTRYVKLSDEILFKVFRERFIDQLYQGECRYCVPVISSNMSISSNTDFLLKFQSCTLECCGYKNDIQPLPIDGLFQPIPIVCCRQFRPLMLELSPTFNIPRELRCRAIQGQPPSTNYPFSTTTCKINEKIPTCEKILKDNYLFKECSRFTKYFSIFLNVFGFYYLFACIMSLFVVIERYSTRRMKLKDIHSKLSRYKV